ncbi:uncharacterized protein LOC144742542 isoform X2 [Ciona intestinalis]
MADMWNKFKEEMKQKRTKKPEHDDMTCDILAGEQGPSCCLLDQLPNFNVVHIRAIANTTELACKENSKFKLVVSSSLPQIKRRKTDNLQPQQISVEFSVKRNTQSPKVYRL